MEEFEVYPPGTLEYGELMRMQAYDDCLRVLARVAARDVTLYSTQDILDMQDEILDLRNELEVGDE